MSLLDHRYAYLNLLEKAFEDIEIQRALPDIDRLTVGGMSGDATLLIVDDFSVEVMNSYDFTQIFLQHSHHFNITVAVTAQNIYLKSKYSCTILRNATCFVVFDNAADKHSITCLSQTVFSKSRFLPDCFEAMHKTLTFGPNALRYLVILCHPAESHSDLRVMTAIFPSDSQSPSNKTESMPIFIVKR